jgi:hypothetical protein
LSLSYTKPGVRIQKRIIFIKSYLKPEFETKL